ncbi:FAD-binding protein [Nocardia sp. alder85J]|uniref:FAD-binding protein n=1 Tax=Nocardia sp. alder85J TaxID=2862949 RepID=UPI001CD4C64F|nr:FAD-binding protein [Nocardia sp. alder85J]MCX4098593.1 FAD-binding protein [Nocardia sp. alder85J]
MTVGTITELARKCGIDAFELDATIADYNRRIVDGVDDAALKADGYRKPITSGPFLAVDFGIENQRMPFVLVSLGGVDVDEHSRQVLRNDGSAIDGLYAVGRTAVGVCTGQYVSGLSLADFVFTGRRAGRHITSGDPGTRL